MAGTDEKINKCIEKSLNYLSAIGRPIVLKCEQRISIQNLLLGKDVIAILPTGFGKNMIFTVYTLAKVSWELLCSPWIVTKTPHEYTRVHTSNIQVHTSTYK